jgi:hypothetical protein
MKKVFIISIVFALFLSACDKDKPGSGTGETDETLTFTSFTPQRGIPGQVIKLTGKNFHANKALNFVDFAGNTAIAEVIEVKADELTVKVPVTAVTGKISVRIGSKTVVSIQDFIVDPALSITGFQPLSGNVGTEVIITGNNFDANPAAKIGGMSVTVLEKSATQIKVLVPANIPLGNHKITVTSHGQTIEAATSFTVVPNADFNWIMKQNIYNVDKLYTDATAFVHGDKLYFGLGKHIGAGPSQYNSHFWQYDVATGEWIQAVQVPAAFALRDRAVAVSLGSKIYVGLGLGKNDWWELNDPRNSNSWRSLNPFPLTTSTNYAFVVNNNFYVAGVRTAATGPQPTIIYRFHPADNNNMGRWEEVAQFYETVFWPSVFVIGADAYIGGDWNVSENARPYYKFSPHNNHSITKVTSLTATEPLNKRRNNAFVLDGKGYVLMEGSKVYEYTPDANGGQWRVAHNNVNGPTIHYGATINGKAYGWDYVGNIHEFRR